MSLLRPKIYLAGAIQRSKDPYTWRKAIKGELEPEYTVIIPEDKLDLPKDCSFEKKQKAICEQIIFRDIDYVSSAEEFFVKIDPDVFKGAGTVSEITFACIWEKPITCWFDGITIDEVPGWVKGCLWNATMVSNIEEAVFHYKALFTRYRNIFSSEDFLSCSKNFNACLSDRPRNPIHL